MTSCIWRNFCTQKDRYMCCHDCKVKDCWQRCKDNLDKCKYKTNDVGDRYKIRPILSSKSIKVDECKSDETVVKKKGRPKKLKQ